MAKTPRPANIHTGPRTWALIREAYLSGETAKAVCARFGVKLHALRAQANRHGWTKRAYADSLVDPAKLRRGTRARRPAHAAPDRSDPLETAPGKREVIDVNVPGLARAVMSDAAIALRDRRVDEAELHLRMAERIAKLAATLPPAPPLLTAEERRQQEADAADAYLKDVWKAAVRLADALLADGRGIPAVHTRAAFAWRADHLGPEAAAHDRATAAYGGWASSVYDEQGRLRPPQTFAEFRAAHGGV